MKALALVGCLIGRQLLAQTDYYNTDAGHPIRVEDATPTARFALDLHFPTARLERLDGGIMRQRLEPAVSFGMLPRTALELRVAFVFRESGAKPRAGMSGAGLGITSAITTETAHIPGIAVGAEAFAPAGGARTGDGTAYSLRSLVTRTTSVARLHANVTFGSYDVTVPAANLEACGYDPASDDGLPCAGGPGAPPFIPDGPCSVAPTNAADVIASRCGGRETRAVTPAAASNGTFRGAHWLVGVGADRPIALASVLLMADVFAERYVGLFNRWDWTAEIGARHQWTPSLTIDASIGRRFAGVTRAWVVSAGLTRSVPVAQPRTGRRR